LQLPETMPLWGDDTSQLVVNLNLEEVAPESTHEGRCMVTNSMVLDYNGLAQSTSDIQNESLQFNDFPRYHRRDNDSAPAALSKAVLLHNAVGSYGTSRTSSTIISDVVSFSCPATPRDYYDHFPFFVNSDKDARSIQFLLDSLKCTSALGGVTSPELAECIQSAASSPIAPATVEALVKRANESKPKAVTLDLGSCSPEKMANAEKGAICHTATADWQAEGWTSFRKKAYRDLTSKVVVSDLVATSLPLYEAETLCARLTQDAWSLPTGSNLFNHVSNDEFAALEADHIRDVVPGLSSQEGTWSKSISSYPAPGFTYYDNATGQTKLIWNKADRMSALCITTTAD